MAANAVVNDRVLVVSAIAALLVAARMVMVLRARRVRPAPDLVAVIDGVRLPTVIAFSAPRCIQCYFAQEPALARLHEAHPGRFAVRHVNVAEDAAVARRFGILTVPSTAVLAPDGSVLAVNHSLAMDDRLAAQLRLARVGAAVPEPS